jgi:glycosyltransferase involved in cell wall biosynthesis
MEPESESRKLSIITVVYNAAELLEGTIHSVRKSDHPDIEYVVIDGGSKDGTLDIIQDNNDLIDLWISDRDKGLYDAMNKGLKIASGKFVWFLNAGDHIASNEILNKILLATETDADIIYGEVMIVDENRKPIGTRSELSTQKLPTNLTWRSFKTGMRVSHQGFIVRRHIASEYILNNLSADIAWCIDCLKKSSKNVHISGIFVNYLAGGISKRKWKQSMLDRYKILQHYYGFLPNLVSHLKIIFRSIFHKIIRLNKESY